MQLLKLLFFLCLLGTPSLGDLIRAPRSAALDVVTQEKSNASLNARADPPADRTYVDIGETKREFNGHSLYTEGLLTCIALVARGNIAQPATQFYDKALAHVASNLCHDGDIPGIDDQVNNFINAVKGGVTAPSIFVIVAPDNGNMAQFAFNNYVFNMCRDNFDDVTMVTRDQSRVNEPGGSRLWIDGGTVYWGAGGDVIVP